MTQGNAEDLDWQRGTLNCLELIGTLLHVLLGGCLLEVVRSPTNHVDILFHSYSSIGFSQSSPLVFRLPGLNR